MRSKSARENVQITKFKREVKGEINRPLAKLICVLLLNVMKPVFIKPRFPISQ